MHDERLPNRECDRCGASFYCESARAYCSEECHDEAVSYTGADNPNYRGGKEATTCDICGEEFEYYPSEKEGLYCSECVENEQWRYRPTVSGADHPRWNGGKITVDCTVCGETVRRHPNQLTGEATLCSRRCHAEWLSDAFAGEGHPNWEGGDTGPYGKGWARVRRQALERDGYECAVCGKGRADIGRNPDVHHIVPVRVFEQAEEYDREDAHVLPNVVSLCVACHRKADFGRIPKGDLWPHAQEAGRGENA
ncbi:MAG: HNH endonuclease [Halorientalis sp.]